MFASLVLSLLVLIPSRSRLSLLIIGLTFVLGPPLIGGTITGYLTTENRLKGAWNGLFSGFVSGMIFGTLVSSAFLLGTRFHPPAEWTLLKLFYAVWPTVLGVGLIYSLAGFAGGWLRYRGEL